MAHELLFFSGGCFIALSQGLSLKVACSAFLSTVMFTCSVTKRGALCGTFRLKKKHWRHLHFNKPFAEQLLLNISNCLHPRLLVVVFLSAIVGSLLCFFVFEGLMQWMLCTTCATSLVWKLNFKYHNCHLCIGPYMRLSLRLHIVLIYHCLSSLRKRLPLRKEAYCTNGFSISYHKRGVFFWWLR